MTLYTEFSARLVDGTIIDIEAATDVPPWFSAQAENELRARTSAELRAQLDADYGAGTYELTIGDTTPFRRIARI